MHRTSSLLSAAARTAAGKMRHADDGMALLAVLVIALVIAGSSASFIWFMSQQQTRAGARLRSAAALATAEAGIHRALSILESVAPDGSAGRAWRPSGHSEDMAVGPLVGRFTVSLTEDGEVIVVTSRGEVAGVTRRLRARVHLASPALLAALHGASVVRFETPPAAAFLLPYGAGIGDRPWIHVGAGKEVWFATTNVSINNPDAVIEAAPGPADAPDGANSGTTLPRPGPIRLLLARGAELTLGGDHRRVDVQQLRAVGVYVDGVVIRTEAFPELPAIDRVYFQSQAADNTGNAGLNEAAGRYVGDRTLASKRDSLYTPQQFEQVQSYLQAGLRPRRFQGVIYVRGGVALFDGQRLEVAEGTLVIEGTLRLSQGAVLEVKHSAATRTLPGIIVLDRGALVVTEQAHLRVHGLVYVNRLFDVGPGARVEIVGAVLGNDPELSFRNLAATVILRYDPAVLGTAGLRVRDDAPVVAWVAAWEELPSPSMGPPSPPQAASQTARSAPPPPPPLPIAPAVVSPPGPRPETPAIPKVTAPLRRAVEATSPEGRVQEQPRHRAQEPPRHRVQVGACANRRNADARVAALRAAGFNPYIVKEGPLVKVFVGAFRNRAAAQALASRLRARGHDAVITP